MSQDFRRQRERGDTYVFNCNSELECTISDAGHLILARVGVLLAAVIGIVAVHQLAVFLSQQHSHRHCARSIHERCGKLNLLEVHVLDCNSFPTI